jgi:hypothetical protein
MPKRRVLATGAGLMLVGVTLVGCDDNEPAATTTQEQVGTSSGQQAGASHASGRPHDVPRGRAEGVPPGPPSNVPPGRYGSPPPGHGGGGPPGPPHTPPGQVGNNRSQSPRFANASAEGSLLENSAVSGSLAAAMAAAMVGGGLLSLRSRRLHRT